MIPSESKPCEKSQIQLKGQRLIDGSKGRTNFDEIHDQGINL